jgi:molybdate transport system substrate-binding protein
MMIIITSCNLTNKNNVVHVAAASNLRYALEEINLEFEKISGVKLEMSVASSGKLTAQIQNGAPFDIFLSANKKYPFYLFEKGFGVSKPKLFCNGLLIYWTIKDIKLKGDLQEIANSNIQKIALANPNNAPFGIASVEALKSISLYDSVSKKLIFAENVSQISQYVLNNNVDIGFTGKSIVLSPKLKGRGQYFDVDEKLYSPIEQYVLLLKNGASNNNAQKYIDFLFSDSAQSIFKRYGYKIPD